mgnify:FL=1
MRIGDPADPSCDMGPLCNPAVLKRAREHVADLRAKGESFAPLALVLKVASAEEAIEIANEPELGLGASL